MIIKLNTKLINSFIAIFIFPSFYFVVFKGTSLALGLIIASFFILLYNYRIVFYGTFKFKYVMLLSFCLSFIFTISAYLYVIKDFTKPLYSVSFFIIIIASYVFAKFLLKISFETMMKTLLVFILLLICFGWLKLLYTPEFLGYTGAKATFPFTEESHFALVLGMVAVAYSFIGNVKWILFILFNTLVFSFLYPSLTMIVFSLLIIFSISLRLKSLKFKFIIFIFTPLLILPMGNLEYFSSRLSFSETDNLTTLVFLQGWELAYLNLINTDGVGLGFQMLGSSETVTGIFTDLINRFGAPLNMEDGGLLAAKIIAEFGVIGIIIIILYIYLIIKILFKTISYYNNPTESYVDKKQFLMNGFIFAFLVEVFLRGYGYFSPGVFMLLTALFYNISLSHIDKKTLLRI